MFKNLSKDKMLNAGYALFTSGLEYYNYMLLMYLIPVWGKEFFAPGHDIFLKGFGIIFLTALTRPIAASLIGNIGDKFGRKRAMLICASIMSIACLTIACLPTYSKVEWLAKYGVLTLIVILCRILQIASAAGKLNGSAIFLIEHFPKRAGLISSVIWFATILGMFVASMTDYFCSLSANTNLWRFAVGAGGLLSFLSFFLIKFLKEGKEYEKSKANEVLHPEEEVTVSRWAYVATFCIACGISGMFYYSTSYIPVLFQKKYAVQSIGLFRGWMIMIYGLGVLLGGMLCDQADRGKVTNNAKLIFLALSAIIFAVFSLIPGFWNPHSLSENCLKLLFGVPEFSKALSASYGAESPAKLLESFMSIIPKDPLMCAFQDFCFFSCLIIGAIVSFIYNSVNLILFRIVSGAMFVLSALKINIPEPMIMSMQNYIIKFQLPIFCAAVVIFRKFVKKALSWVWAHISAIILGIILLMTCFKTSLGIFSLVIFVLIYSVWRENIPPKTYSIMALGAIAPLALSVPCILKVLHSSDLSLQAFSLLFTGFFVGPSHKIMNQLFPPNKRYKSVSLCYAVATALVGGSSTFVCLKLEGFSPILPAAFMVLSSAIGIFGIFAARKSMGLDKGEKEAIIDS